MCLTGARAPLQPAPARWCVALCRSGTPIRVPVMQQLGALMLRQAMSGDYLGNRAARRFAGTPLRCLVTGFVVSAASNNCRNPFANSSTAFPKAAELPNPDYRDGSVQVKRRGTQDFHGIERMISGNKASG